MVSSPWLRTLALLAVTLPIVMGQRNTCAPDEDGRRGGECIRGQGRQFAFAFCSSFLPITTPVVTSFTTVTDTVTSDRTEFTATETETFSPPTTTTTSSETAKFSSTVTETSVDTVTTGTITSFISTTTESTISYTNVYKCPGDPAPSSAGGNSSSSSNSRSGTPTLSFPTTRKNVTSGHGGPTGTITMGTGTGTGIIGTGTSSSFVFSGSLPYYTWTRSSSSLIPSLSSAPPYYHSPDPTTSSSSSDYIPPYITATYGAYGKEKRQVFGRPRCLRKLDRTSGLAGISDACNCLDIATPTPSQTVSTIVDPSNTVTFTNIVRTTTTFTTTPTVTVTQSVDKTSLFTSTKTSTTSLATTVPGTLTITRTSISTLVGPSPTPSTFNIFYTLNSTTPANFFQAGPAPGGSGIVLAPESQADFFAIDGMRRLLDTTAGSLFMAKNTQDLYPFALLQTTAENANTAVCSACGGRLQCDWPGTQGNVWALCYGFLALGRPEVFGLDADADGDVDCRVVDLRFK